MKTIVACPWLLCPLLAVALLVPRSADGQVAKETLLITRVLPDVPGRNASTTEPATLLVFFVKKVSAPSTTH